MKQLINKTLTDYFEIQHRENKQYRCAIKKILHRDKKCLRKEEKNEFKKKDLFCIIDEL